MENYCVKYCLQGHRFWSIMYTELLFAEMEIVMNADREMRTVKTSVRNLVEFILRSGDLDNRYSKRDPDAMQEGSRLHRKIQKQMGPDYSAEVPLAISVEVGDGEDAFMLTIEGRADGIIRRDGEVIIDEIKSVYADLERLLEPAGVHRAQAMCYACIYASLNNLERIGVQMTYCNIETEIIKQFNEVFQIQELKDWFDSLVDEYAKWAIWEYRWHEERNESIRGSQFPFCYREGQRELVAGVYRTILRSRNLFIEAPTGVGKTMSTVFPTVRAMGEGKAEKIFYLTAKTITRTVAEEAFNILIGKGVKFKLVTITAKDKICVLEKPDCNPVACERAAGHYDRVNDAVFDMLEHETQITRELIESYALRHMVCPFEMALDVTLWADGVICDYNYVFDPNVYLRRFFADEKKHDYVFLIDEAHNLVDRAREMYSAVLVKEEIMAVQRKIKDMREYSKLKASLEKANRVMLSMKRECDEFEVWESVDTLALSLMRVMSAYEDLSREAGAVLGEEMSMLYLEIRHFLNIHDVLDENYTMYTDYSENGQFRVKLQCMDPSVNLSTRLERGRSSVFFSATLLPINYYKEQLGGTEEDYAVYAPSPFDSGNRLILIGSDVSTKYTRRSVSEYERIVSYIIEVTESRVGNYMVFFPSYKMMRDIAELAGWDDTLEQEPDTSGCGRLRIKGMKLQRSDMTEAQKEEFLACFEENPECTHVGFCVMGGIFGEGIDLKNDRLIGAVIVGTGLPMVCNERELFRGFYDGRGNKGFEYAYLYSGMNKVLQSAGRVIRTTDDRGVILLLDERFRTQQYQELFPREWFPHTNVNIGNVREAVQSFWEEKI